VSLARRYVRPDEWKPTGIEKLEPNALEVVQSANNRSVIAGPGSGKTELLAQRASYLLQCGVCVVPRRILAISYKRDAAFNIHRRVSTRCHPEQAHRFDSQTFDAFAKGLLDRFGQALPQFWRPTPDYDIAPARDPVVREFLDSLSPPASVGSDADIMTIGVKNFEKRWVVSAPVRPEGFVAPTSAGAWAGQQFWKSWLRGEAKSYLTFAMIGRLAELLVRTNPMVRQALRLTYSHLFMDEFQDTTQVQYDLVKTIFVGSNAVVTAVGDNKQQIMRWAMAMDDPFATYEADFKADRTPLKHNYRSSPDLVRIQDILARALDSKSVAGAGRVVRVPPATAPPEDGFAADRGSGAWRGSHWSTSAPKHS
jgi:superfamily I DNA/RNA helicase